MDDTTDTDCATPFEQGNGNQTTTWHDCIAFHSKLAQAFPQWLRVLTGCFDRCHRR